MEKTYPDFLEEAVKTARDIWSKGWAEGSAGNISLRLDPNGLQSDAPLEPRTGWVALERGFPDLANERFIMSGTGRHLRNMEIFPRQNVGVIELDGSGLKYRVLWGYESGCAPTSELPVHLKVHEVRKKVGKGTDRTVIHAHAPNLITLTYTLDLNTHRLSRLLWEMHAECIFVFPEGVEFVPWMFPGSRELADATARGLEKRRMALWQFHGVVATGCSPDEAFGIIETGEKAAEIYLQVMAAGGIRQKLTIKQLKDVVKRFDLKPDPSIFDM